MQDMPLDENQDWKESFDRLSQIRETGDYTLETVEFIRGEMQSFDERIRAAAVLAAGGCVFEPYILDQLINIAEYDETPAIRKAAVQSMSGVISEGVAEGMEDASGADTQLDDAEEWEEFQAGSLRDDYQRVKNLLFNYLEYDEDIEVRELALTALADLGSMPEIQAFIEELFSSDRPESKLAALRTMGKYPQNWLDHLHQLIKPETQTELLREAVSASYSSESRMLAKAIEGILDQSDDPQTIQFALLTLTNINKTENLPDILQKFVLHSDPLVQETARDSINKYTQMNFEKYMRDDFGMED